MDTDLDDGGGSDETLDGSTGDEDEMKRAAATCEHCGSCHVVRVRRDGTVRVVGTNGTCECGESDYRILGAARQRDDPAAKRDGPSREASEV